MRCLLFPALVLAAVLAPLPASAEVMNSSTTGFTTSDKLTTPASPQEVWTALVRPQDWWNPEHSWSGDAGNLHLEPRAGGCFCEALPGGGSVQHMAVMQAAPAALLRMSGALGPLQSEALIGTLSIALTETEGGTTIEWIYVVGGHARFPLEQVAPAVDAVMTEQLHRLGEHLADENG